MKTRFTLKTLLIITLVVAAYFAGRQKVGELEMENEELRSKVRVLEKDIGELSAHFRDFVEKMRFR